VISHIILTFLPFVLLYLILIPISVCYYGYRQLRLIYYFLLYYDCRRFLFHEMLVSAWHIFTSDTFIRCKSRLTYIGQKSKTLRNEIGLVVYAYLLATLAPTVIHSRTEVLGY
jgi:hypothetical protein